MSLRTLLFLSMLLPCAVAQAQKGGRLPDVSSTVKGDLVMPVPFKNPIFHNYIEVIGQMGLTFQVPVRNGLGAGVGANMSWMTLKERTLAPAVAAGDVRRLVFFGKAQYEHYTGQRTFYELWGRLGMTGYEYSCPTCVGHKDYVPYWGFGFGYYINATDNLAFGLTLGYDNSAGTFEASDLGLTTFPGTRDTGEQRHYQNVLVGLGFSTRLRRSEREAATW